MKLQNWLSVLTFDVVKYIGAGGEVVIDWTADGLTSVSYTHLRAHETVLDLVCRLLLEKKKNTQIIARLTYPISY